MIMQRRSSISWLETVLLYCHQLIVYCTYLAIHAFEHTYNKPNLGYALILLYLYIILL